MGISALVGNVLDGPVTALRRQVLSLAVAVAAAIGAVFYGASAVMLALEMALGPLLARAAIALILVLIAIAAYFTPRLLNRTKPHEPPPVEDFETEMATMTRDQRIAMVFEALLLGFSMGSRKAAASPDSSK